MAESSLIKVVGVDASNSPLMEAKPLTSTPMVQVADITQEKYAQARQHQNAGYEAMMRSIGEVGNAKSKEALSRSQSGTAEQLAGIVGNIMGAYQKYQEQQSKYDSEAAKLRQEEDNTAATQIIKDNLLQLYQVTNAEGMQTGINQTKAQFAQVINNQFSHLPPKMREELWKMAYAGLDDVQKTQASRTFQQATEAREANRDLRLAQMNRMTSAWSVRLSTAVNQEDQQTAWEGFWTAFNEGAEKMQLDDLSKAKIASNLLNQAVANFQGGEKQRQQLIEQANAVSQFYQNMQGTVDGYSQGKVGDYEKEAKAQYEAARLGIPGLANRLPDVFSVTERAAEYSQNQERLQQAARDANSVISFDDANVAQMYHIGSLVYELQKNTPQARMLMMAAKDKNQNISPLQRAAVETFREFADDRKEWNNLKIRIAETNVSLAKVMDDVQPGRLGDVQYVDTLLQKLVTLPNTAAFRGMKASPEVMKAYSTLKDELLPRMRDLREKWLGIGMDIENPNNKTYLQKLDAQTSAVRNSVQQYKPQGNPFPNFNRGVASGMPATPVVTPLKKMSNGGISPFHSKVTGVSVTSAYGWRVHPVHGDRRFHAGIDLVPHGNDTVHTIQGGKVIMVKDWTGYGGTVMVQTHDGRVEQFSHLRNFNVRMGQTIPPGTPIGLMGGAQSDPMPGTSTGRHVHFQVWQNAKDFSNPQANTLDPQRYMSEVRLPTVRPRNVGLPPSQGGVGRMGTVNPLWMFNPNYQDTTANATRNRYAPIHRSAYPRTNDPRANYGYTAIAKDAQFAAKIAAVANKHGIAAQWLVDVMAFETGGTFSPSIRNGEGATGLIQFYPDNVGGRYKTMNGRRIDLDQIARMTRTQQMDLVDEYLTEFSGKMKTVEDVLAAVFGGYGLFSKSPQQRANIDDRQITFASYVRRLGEHVGRRYSSSYDRFNNSRQQIHTTPRIGCPTCTAMLSRNGKIQPHEGSL